jgi:hypothetical protein
LIQNLIHPFPGFCQLLRAEALAVVIFEQRAFGLLILITHDETHTSQAQRVGGLFFDEAQEFRQLSILTRMRAYTGNDIAIQRRLALKELMKAALQPTTQRRGGKGERENQEGFDRSCA